MNCKMIGYLLAGLSLLLLAGCMDFGKVDQGRTVAFDKEKGIVTIIHDNSKDPLKPDYSKLPPVTYKIPVDPHEMGPEPMPGLRMKLDTAKNQVILYDPKTQNFANINYTPVNLQENIDKSHPLVFDAETGKAKKFPKVDKEKKTVTIYSGRQKMLITFTPPEEYLALPDAAWNAGDEVRIYYKQEGQALRFMNITKTDIYKK